MSQTDHVDDSSFDALVEEAREGSGLALRHIHDALGPRILGYLRSQGVGDPEANANEVFFRGFTKIQQFKGAAAGFRSWLFTIAHNIVIDDRRARSRRPVTEPVGSEAHRLERAGGDTEGDAIDALGLGAAARILQRLTPAQRDVVFLRVVAGLSVRETAEVVGRPQGAVKGLQHRGLVALRTMLADVGVTDSSAGTFPSVT